MECPDCGMAYVAGLEQDERVHERYHDEWENGVTFPVTSSDRIVSTVRGMDLLEARPEHPDEYRKRFWNVALRAGRDTDFMTQYDGGRAEAEWDGRAYVLRCNDRAVAFAVVRRRDQFWWWSWADYEAQPRQMPQAVASSTVRRSVDFVWVLPRLQKCGLGSALIRAVAAHLVVPVTEFGWTLEFTPSGRRLARRLTEGGFWAS